MRQLQTLALWALVVLALAASPQISSGQDLEKQRAAAAINEGRYGEALSILQSQINASTTDAELYLLRARAYEGREEYQRAISDYERVLELTPGNATATAGLSRARSRSQSSRGDLENMRRLVSANPDNLKNRLQFADALYEAGIFKEAADHYEVYLQKTQGTPDILRRFLISIASYEGDNPRGERVAAQYLRFYPTDDDLHMRLGYFRLWQGKYSEAREAFATAIKLNPQNQDARRGLEQTDRPSEHQPGEAQPARQSYAVDALSRSLEQNPNQDEKRFELARELVKAERYWEAYEQLQRLAGRHQNSDRWMSLFVQVDRGLIRTTGSSPLYPVDRISILLRANPSDADLRYELVDALIQAGRLEEARDALVREPHARPNDDRYKVRLQAIENERERLTSQRITVLRARLQARPGDPEATSELGMLLLQNGDLDSALSLLQQAVEASPTDAELRFNYAQALNRAARHAEALEHADRLLERNPNNHRYQRLYAEAAIASGNVSQRAEEYLDEMLKQGDQDAGLLLDLASLRLSQGKAQEADRILRRAVTVADNRFDQRIEAMSLLIEREQVREQETEQMEILNDARRLAAAQLYQESIVRFEEYFEARGKRSRAELKELAQVHSAAGDFVSALSILDALQMQIDEYDVAKDIAKNRFYAQDYSGAIRVLEDLVKRNPNDFEVRLLLGDSYRQIEQYARAREVYQDALASAPNSEIVEQRIVVLEAASVTGIARSGEWRGLDYMGLIVPVGDAIMARGSGTSYNRWSQGIFTQVTLPIHAVLTAGLTSHFLSGSRRLIPNSETVSERVNQVYGGLYIDLTPPLPRARPNFTNRITATAGIFDYEGGRTIPFGELRFWHQDEDVYQASIGVRSTEGALELWSPAGGEFALRLTQFDVRANSVTMMPDSLLKINGVVAYNVVKDNFGNVGTDAGTNTGVQVNAEGAYRVIPFTFAGIRYEYLGYRNSVDIYFSPRSYQTYNAFLEYEREYGSKWYFRLRGSLGIVSRSNGFVARRMESDLIYRLAPKFTLNMTAGVGQSTRALSNQPAPFEDRYNTFLLSGALYWTL